MRMTELKIKQLSLAEEARIIRKYERSVLRNARWQKSNQGHEDDSVVSYATYTRLHEHRTHQVRKASRAAGLVRAFLKGREYARVEKPRSDNAIPRDLVIDNMVTFAGMSKDEARKAIENWVSA